jgi:four helix bundle protein
MSQNDRVAPHGRMRKEVDIDLQTAKPGSLQHVSVLIGRQIRALLIRDHKFTAIDHSAQQPLIRSACSVGANDREAQYAESRRDFTYKLKIAEKELNETFFWIGLLCSDPPSLSEEEVEPVLKTTHSC